jgi:hypothetical protein
VGLPAAALIYAELIKEEKAGSSNALAQQIARNANKIVQKEK